MLLATRPTDTTPYRTNHPERLAKLLTAWPLVSPEPLQVQLFVALVLRNDVTARRKVVEEALAGRLRDEWSMYSWGTRLRQRQLDDHREWEGLLGLDV